MVSSEVAPPEWTKRLQDRYKTLRAKYEGQWQGSAVGALAAKILPELDARRKIAVDFIASDAYKKDTQLKLDEMVKKVEEMAGHEVEGKFKLSAFTDTARVHVEGQ